MSAVLNHNAKKLHINQEIQQHKAWLGHISGLKAEKMLRGLNTPYLYILREGENEEIVDGAYVKDYYVSFILPDLSIRHQPFTVTVTADAWHCENYGPRGPYTTESIDDVLYLMMHCNKDQCASYIA